jgi:septum formation protein
LSANQLPVRLTLVSASPRRRELLARLDLPFDVVPSEADEILEGPDPISLAAQNAQRKVQGSVHFGDRSRLLLGADTIIAFAGQIFGKPAGIEGARRMLTALSGQVHEVITGVCLSGPALVTAAPAIQVETAAVSRVRFHSLTPQDIEAYLDSQEWEGKAGAYAIQGLGSSLVADLDGDLDNVIGLPTHLIHDLLRTHYRHCRFL